MSRTGENSLMEEAPETPALKMAASLGCTGNTFILNYLILSVHYIIKTI
jgi:hypothetical protein